MGLSSDFFNALSGAIRYILDLMQSTVIFRAYGYTITLWDLHAISTTLLHFFNAIIVPLVGVVPGVDDYMEQEQEEEKMNAYLEASKYNSFYRDDDD